MLCIFCSVIFQVCTFCHFPVCVFSVIFHVMPFPFYSFQCCAFSVLSFFRWLFSAIFQYVYFLPFSMLCIFRYTIFRVCVFFHFPVSVFSTIFHVMHFHTPIFRVCIFCHFLVCLFSAIFCVMHFPFCHFQGVHFLPFSGMHIFCYLLCPAFSVLPFSMLCIYNSIIVQVCIFCHFPVYVFYAIFCVVHFPFCHCQGVYFLPFSSMCIFCHFPCCAFSIQSFLGCGFSAIIQYVYFLPFSVSCLYVLQFSGCAFSAIFQYVYFMPFSMSCIFLSFIFLVVQIPFYQFPGRANSAPPHLNVCLFFHFQVHVFS